MKKEDITPTLIESLIQAAKNDHERRLKPMIEKARRYKKGQQWTPGSGEDDAEYNGHEIVANMALPTTVSIMAAIYSNRPLWFADGDGPGMAMWEQIAGAYLNWATQDKGYGLGRKCGLVIQDGIESGAGYLEIGNKVVGRKKVTLADGSTKTVAKLDIFVERRSALDVLVDPNANEDLESASYLAVRDRMPAYQVRADERYDKEVREHIKGGVVSERASRTTGDKEVPEEFRETITYDVQIKADDGKNVGWLTTYTEEDTNGLLRKPVKNPFPCEGFTIVAFVDYVNLDEWHPQGDIEPIIDLQNGVNNVISKQNTHLDRAASKIGLDEAALTDETIEALESNDIFKGVKFNLNGGKKLNDVITAIDFSNISPDHYNFKTELMDFINLISGISNMQLGAQMDTRRTATEINAVSRGSDLRSKQKQDSLYLFFSRVGQRSLDFLRATFDDEQVIEITGEIKELKATMRQVEGQDVWVGDDYKPPLEGEEDTYSGPRLIQDGKKHWLSFIPAQIPNGITITIDPTSTQPKNKEVDRALFVSFVQTLMQIQQMLIELAKAGVPMFIKWPEIVDEIFEQFDKKDPDKYFDRAALEEMFAQFQQQIEAAQAVPAAANAAQNPENPQQTTEPTPEELAAAGYSEIPLNNPQEQVPEGYAEIPL